MIENRDIQVGAVTLTKLSKNLRLPFSNIVKGTAGQIPVVQADGDLGFVNVSGDGTLGSDGSLTVNLGATSTDGMPEGGNNLYYTDARVDARIREIKNEVDQQATSEEPGFMPKEDKQKLDRTPDAASTIRIYTETITGDGSKTIFTVNHGLSSFALMVSVRHYDDPYSNASAPATDIGEMFDYDYYTQMDVGYSAAVPGVEIATFDDSGTLSDNHLSLRFPSAAGNGKQFLVTVMG